MMMVQRLVSHLAVLIFSIVMLSGCSLTNSKTEQYYTAAKEFNNIYFQVVEHVELNNDAKSIESLQSEDDRAKIAKLGELLETVKKTVPENRIPTYYGFRDRYDDLIFLRNLYGRKFSELSTEERGRIDMTIIDINANKADWNDKKSNTVWE